MINKISAVKRSNEYWQTFKNFLGDHKKRCFYRLCNKDVPLVILGIEKRDTSVLLSRTYWRKINVLLEHGVQALFYGAEIFKIFFNTKSPLLNLLPKYKSKIHEKMPFENSVLCTFIIPASTT